MDADQFEVLIAAILVAGRTAGARRDSTGMRPANAVVGDMAITIRELRLRGFTGGTIDVPEAD
jgi:hypothetical protein